jgi:hypothetical protein
VLTPIVPGHEGALRRYLETLSESEGRSPLSRLPRTHFARWVIIPDFIPDPDPEQPSPDHLGCEYLLFTSNLDGPVDDYLAALCDELTAEAPQIWGHCIGCPDPAVGAALKIYLRHNQIATGLFFAAYPKASLAQVMRCLDARDRLVRLVVAAQHEDPASVHNAFIHEFCP